MYDKLLHLRIMYAALASEHRNIQRSLIGTEWIVVLEGQASLLPIRQSGCSEEASKFHFPTDAATRYSLDRSEMFVY